MATVSSQGWMARNKITWNLIVASLLISLTVFNYGFDITAYSTIQAMDPFIEQFGDCNAKGTCAISTRNLAFLNSFPRISFAVGVTSGSLIGNRFGRRPVIFIYCIIAIISAVVSYTAKSYGQVLAGRMIGYMYVGMEGWLVPMFQAEIVPARIRGAMVVTYVFNHIAGSFLMACITFKTAKWSTNSSWQIPLALGIIMPAIVLLLIWKIPESPRWLVRRGRDEDALKSLRYIYGTTPDYAPEEELVLLKTSLEEERSREGGSWTEMFRGLNKKRTTIAIITQILNQATGQAFVSQYGTIFIKSLHTINPFTFNVINSGINCIGPFATIFIIDKMGRRRMYLVFGTATCTAIMIVGGLGFATATAAVKSGIVSMTVLYTLFYIMSFGPIGAVTSAEVSSLQLRDKTSELGWNIQNITNFVVSFTLPYLMNKPYAGLGSKVGFIYGIISLIGLIWAHFYFPELKGRSLEEVDEMFAARVPARKSRRWVSSNPDSVGAQITRLENSKGDPELLTAKQIGDEDDIDKPAAQHVQTAGKE